MNNCGWVRNGGKCILEQENQKLKDRDLIMAAELTKLQDENKQLKQWDINKDTRNSRQRIANKNLTRAFRKLKKDNNVIINHNVKLLKENKQLKDNWNKLKDYIVKEYYIHLPLEASTTSIIILINKMQEIEDGINEYI